MLTEIAFDPAPILANSSPANSDKLAQRNFQIVGAAEPGTVGSRRIPSTFEILPTSSAHVNELLINWSNIPVGSTVQLFIPTVEVSDVLALAGRMYGSHSLTGFDNHTLQPPLTPITYIPIPPGGKVNHTALLTVDLLHSRQLFTVIVQQITDVSATIERTSPPPTVPAMNALLQTVKPRVIRWRSVRGSFQVTITMSAESVMLRVEEQLLSKPKRRGGGLMGRWCGMTALE